jgi:hypothetical protein
VYGGPVLLSVNITIYCVTDLYVLLGAEEGMFTLQVNTTQDPVMEQISPRSCQWLRVVENVLIWLSGTLDNVYYIIYSLDGLLH